MKAMMSKAAVASLVLGAAALVTGSYSAATADGKSLFTANNCNSCHSVTALSIAKTNAKSKAPDLSGVGKAHKADWIAKYLQKTETRNGKQHPPKWKGSDGDLNALAAWLGKQKS